MDILHNLFQGFQIIFQPDNFSNPIDEKYIPEKTVEKDVKYFIKNSFGFGGNNVSMVIKNLF